MKLSIIIVNYSTGKLTSDCINSIMSQHLPFDYEVVIVDNGSVDGSSLIFKQYESNKLTRLFYNYRNLGFSIGVNIGIKNSKGEYKLLLNSDTIAKRGSITKLLDFSLKQEDAGVVGGQLLNPDMSIQPSCFNLPVIKNAILEYWLGKKGKYDKFIPKSHKASIVDSVVGAVMLITPEAINRVGLFDERYFMHYEDHDYCKRINKSGLKVYYLPGAQFIHHHGKSGENITIFENQWRRLIPSSKIYNGIIKHYIINFVIWSGQKFHK